MIAKCPKRIYIFEKGNRACYNGDNNSDCDIYVSLERMSNNEKWKNRGKAEN